MSTRTGDERGSVSIWLALCSLVMVILLGLAIDLSGQVGALQRDHDLAAQAARTGAQQLQAAPAIQGTGALINPGPATRAAQQYLSAAGVSGTVTVTATTLTVTVTDHYPTRFLGLVGISHLPITTTATAHLIRTLGGTPR